MTVELKILLNVSSNMDEIRDTVAKLVGHPLSRVEDDMGVSFTTKALCIEWMLYGDHGFEDDCGIEFTKYEYVLDLIPLDAGPDLAAYDLMYEGAALFMAYQLSRVLGCRTLVVRNLTRKVAAYSSGRRQTLENSSKALSLERS
jgi:hypothetical protein